jgi:hypothetical protein
MRHWRWRAISCPPALARCCPVRVLLARGFFVPLTIAWVDSEGCRRAPLMPYCRSALNSLSPNALACPAVEPILARGFFVCSLAWLKPYTRPAAILVSKLDSRRLESLADCDNRALMQPLALFQTKDSVRADDGPCRKLQHADPEGSARHLALCRVQICRRHPHPRRIVTIRDHARGEPDTQAALKRRGYQWRRWRRAATNAARGYARPGRELQRRNPEAGDGRLIFVKMVA